MQFVLLPMGAFYISGGPIALESLARATNNNRMVILGRVQNGVVLLDGESALPEGAAVTVTFPVPPTAKLAIKKHRIEIPLVRTDQPGSVQLTGARIADIMDQEDAAPRH